jgi:hypothetical protein
VIRLPLAPIPHDVRHPSWEDAALVELLETLLEDSWNSRVRDVAKGVTRSRFAVPNSARDYLHADGSRGPWLAQAQTPPPRPPRTRLKMKTTRAMMARTTRMVHSIVSLRRWGVVRDIRSELDADRFQIAPPGTRRNVGLPHGTTQA